MIKGTFWLGIYVGFFRPTWGQRLLRGSTWGASSQPSDSQPDAMAMVTPKSNFYDLKTNRLDDFSLRLNPD